MRVLPALRLGDALDADHGQVVPSLQEDEPPVVHLARALRARAPPPRSPRRAPASFASIVMELKVADRHRRPALLVEQLVGHLREHLGVPIDVLRRGRGRHQRHVVERRHEDASVQQVEVDERIEFVVLPRGRLAPVASAVGSEQVLDAAPEPHDVPRETTAGDHVLHTLARTAPPSWIIRANASSVMTSPRVARMAASDSAFPASVPPDPPDIGVLPVRLRVDALGELLGEAVGARRDAGAEGLPDRHDVGLQAPRRGAPAGTRADRVRLIDQQRGARTACRARGPPRGSRDRAARCRCS